MLFEFWFTLSFIATALFSFCVGGRLKLAGGCFFVHGFYTRVLLKVLFFFGRVVRSMEYKGSFFLEF